MLGIRWLLSGSMSLVVAALLWGAATSAGAQLTSSKGSSGALPYIFDIAVDRSDTGYVLLATSQGLYRVAQDGRAVLVSRRKNPIWSLAASPRDTWLLYARGISDEGRSTGIIVSRDSGRSWRSLDVPQRSPRYLRLIETSKADGSIIYAANFYFWTGRAAGTEWIRSALPSSRVIDLAASALAARRIYAATWRGVQSSEDGGRSWKAARPGVCSQPAIAVDTGSDGTIYAFSLCSGLLRGDERTGEWTVVNDGFGGCIVQHLAVDPEDSDRLYAVIGCSGIISSADGGRTWAALGSQETWTPECVTNPYGQPEPEERVETQPEENTAVLPVPANYEDRQRDR